MPVRTVGGRQVLDSGSITTSAKEFDIVVSEKFGLRFRLLDDGRDELEMRMVAGVYELVNFDKNVITTYVKDIQLDGFGINPLYLNLSITGHPERFGAVVVYTIYL